MLMKSDPIQQASTNMPFDECYQSENFGFGQEDETQDPSTEASEHYDDLLHQESEHEEEKELQKEFEDACRDAASASCGSVPAVFDRDGEINFINIIFSSNAL